ncbi:hypothetical protein YPPY92_1133, partial [Yersinia pestis PY-92]
MNGEDRQKSKASA